MERLSGDAAEPVNTIVFSQKFSHGHRRVRAFALASAGLLLCSPFALVLATTASRLRLVELTNAEPIVVAQLAMVAAIGLAAFYFGTAELSREVVRERIIKLDGDNAIVNDTVRGRTHRWQTPISAFRGVRHRVLTTSGGTIHTLQLEHDQPARSLHIAYETYIANQTILDAARQYDLPILQPASLNLSQRWTKSLSAVLNKLGRPPGGDRQTAST